MERRKSHCQISVQSHVHEPFKATKIWNQLIAHLRTNLESKRRRWKMQFYENCFKGSEVIEVLYHYIRNHPDLANNASRSQVKSLCQCLIDSKVLECVIVNDASNKRESIIFEGGSKLYRFAGRNSEGDCNSKKAEENTDSINSNDVWLRAETDKRRRTSSSKNEKYREESKENCESERKRSCSRKRKSIGGVYQSAFGYASPWKKRRKSLDSHFKVRQTSDWEAEDTFGEGRKDVYFQIALAKLLQLLEVQFLEEVLGPSTMESSCEQGSIVIANTSHSLSQVELTTLINNTVNEEWIEDHDKESNWSKAAMDCLKARNEFVLPCKEQVGYQNVTNLTKAGVCESLTEYYASLLDSLIPSNFSVIVESIMKLWKAGRKLKVLAALKLLMILIPLHCRKHLEGLLCFIKKTMTCSTRVIPGNVATRFITRKFMGAVLPKIVRDKSAAEQLITFMVNKQIQIFTVPASVKTLAIKHRKYLKTGVGEPAIQSACQQISKAEYEQQRDHVTHEALVNLINSVMDDLHLSLKEKQQRIHLFEKHHRAVFLTQFPTGKI